MFYVYTVYRDDHVAPVLSGEVDSVSQEDIDRLADRFGLGDYLSTSTRGTRHYADGKVTVSRKVPV